MKNNKRLLTVIICLLMIVNFMNVNAFASEVTDELPFDISAEYAILIERHTGKVLYEKNADGITYPASTTKILTALIMLDYIDMDEIIVAGTEIKEIPKDSSIAGHFVGESIIGENLLRGLILPSGNETGCIIASVIGKELTNNQALGYRDAEELFSGLMNDRAKEIGAVNSHFVNPHGYHDDNHTTTARDMALISREALKNEDFFRTMKETEYKGNSAGDKKTSDMKTQNYDWKTTNLIITNGVYYYPYAMGIKTGYTTPAGYCLISYAEKDGKELISVILKDGQEKRWKNTEKLFNYGFETYDYHFVQKSGDVKAEKMPIYDPKLGEPTEMDVISNEEFIGFYSKVEFERIETELIFKDEYIAKPKKEKEEDANAPQQLALPIKKDDVLGTVRYTLDGAVIYEGALLATFDAEIRTYKTDIKYYFDMFRSNIFSVKALPGWVMIIAVIVLIISFISFLTNRKKKREKYIFNKRRSNRR